VSQIGKHICIIYVIDSWSLSVPTVVLHHGKPELLFAACGQFGTEDTRWVSLAFVVALCVSRQGYDVLVLWVFSVF